PRIEWRPESVVLLPDGDHAVSRGPYRVRSMRDGQPVERWGEFMSIWQRGEQGWQVIYDVAARNDLVPSDAQRALLGKGACIVE
ncbi:MAG TPA: nuclear transport factor 2 family protein, partial [Arenimonas sp.]|nr:nuclear transport factor 2 family protein [Arenimonas sp.]